ncbi:MAG: hypothetical protein OEW00_01100 [candidate division Zixibacteria bacterium]|nr:hypothetical protein [candidate division Zixibacteria bacterium]
MTKRALLTTMIGYCLALLLLGLVGGILAPTAAFADGSSTDPPADSTPEGTSQAPYADSGESIAIIDFLLAAWAMTL